jgi:uncharacterized protein
MTPHTIKLAVITGQHPFDVIGFTTLLRSMPGLEFYLQNLDNFAAADQKTRDSYDVLMFYNFHRETPGNEQNWWEKGIKESLENIGKTKQGVLILHHALLAFINWEFWSDLIGIPDRSHAVLPGQTVVSDIVNPGLAISQSLTPWEMIDEIYTMAEPGEESEVILRTRNPLSIKALAWTRQYQQSRILCYQSGHDRNAYDNLNYRAFLQQGISWLAGGKL